MYGLRNLYIRIMFYQLTFKLDKIHKTFNINCGNITPKILIFPLERNFLNVFQFKLPLNSY